MFKLQDPLDNIPHLKTETENTFDQLQKRYHKNYYNNLSLSLVNSNLGTNIKQNL